MGLSSRVVRGAVEVKSFIRQHEQVFILVGALIVGVGFFVREYFLATDRDDLTSLASAQTEYMIEANFYTTIGAVEDVRDQSTVRCGDQASTAADKRDQFIKSMVEDCLDFSDQSLNRVSALLGTFPEKPTALVTKLDALEKEYERTWADYDSGRLLKPGSNGSAKPISDVQNLYSKTQQFEKDVVDQGYGQRDRLRYRIRQFTLLSYGLFLLGWFVGLLAKLFKIQDGTSASD